MTAPRCVIVTDDAFLAGLVDLLLDHGEYERRRAQNVREAEALLDSWHPELIILDIDIDDLTGIQLIGRWKRRAGALPIIGVTRRNTIEGRLEAFQNGVDDLLAIPFPPEELIARCIGVMRRIHGRDVTFLPTVDVGPLQIDLLHQRLKADGRDIELTHIESALLYLLAANSGQVITRDQLLEYVWGWDPDVGSNLIDRHIVNLRKKLGDDLHEPRFIETLPGKGYRFKAAR